MVNFEQIQIGLSNYFDNEIIAKTTGKQKFLYAFLKGAFIGKVPKLFEKYKDNEMVKALDIIDGNNMIDIDSVYKWAKDAVQQSGQFLFGGIIFNETDIDKLYNYIKQTAPNEV